MIIWTAVTAAGALEDQQNGTDSNRRGLSRGGGVAAQATPAVMELPYVSVLKA